MDPVTPLIVNTNHTPGAPRKLPNINGTEIKMMKPVDLFNAKKDEKKTK